MLWQNKIPHSYVKKLKALDYFVDKGRKTRIYLHTRDINQINSNLLGPELLNLLGHPDERRW